MSDKYIKLLNCATPENVHARVRELVSGLSDKQHLIRSTILEIHANIETRMKQILFHHMSNLVMRTTEEDIYNSHLDRLAEIIGKMHFSHVYRLLRPCFEAFMSSSLEIDLPALNDLRVTAAHGNPSKAVYKGRNPYNDPDSLAEVFWCAWAISSEMRKFFERMITDAEAARKVGERYWLGLPINDFIESKITANKATETNL